MCGKNRLVFKSLEGSVVGRTGGWNDLGLIEQREHLK